jgi:hypothetical protein
MASRLTSISDVTKKGFITLVVVIILFFVGKYTLEAGYRACCVRPTPTPTPYMNPLFGQLDLPMVPETVRSSANLTLHLETIDGNLPPSTDSAMVYEVIKKNPELNYAEKSQNIANQLGFTNIKATLTSTQNYFWQSPTDPNMKLDVDFIYYMINFRYDNTNSYVAIQPGSTPTIENVTNAGYSLMSSLREDIHKMSNWDKQFETFGTYLYIDPTTGQQQEVRNHQQANVTQINFTRAPVNGYPIIDPSTKTALINFTYTGIPLSADPSNFKDRLLKAELKFWFLNLNPRIPAVYALRTTEQAWQDLQSGKGYVLSEITPGDEYNVRKVYLAYYNPPIYSPVMQPVWVFEGDKVSDTNFLFRAFVPAVIESMINTQ